jgi:putative spermidine/putrescine transport system permease protein
LNAPANLESSDQRLARRVGLLLLLAGIVAPMAWALVYSALYSFGGIGLLSEGWTLWHWRSALTSGGLVPSLILSVAVAATVAALTTIGALTITLLSAVPRCGRSPTVPHNRPKVSRNGWLRALLCLPLATPAVVAGLMAYQVLNPGGLLSRLVCHTGAIESPSDFPALVNDRWAIGIILTQFMTALPLLTLFFLAAWTSAHVDRYCRLAESLGATPTQARLRIALPMLLRRALPLITLIFLWQLGTYEIPLLLGRQSPQMFSVLTQRHFGQFDLEQRPEAFTLAVTYLLLTGAGLLILLLRRSHRADAH